MRGMMRLSELTAGLPIERVGGSEDPAIAGVSDDSRTVSAGGLFVARVGAEADGRHYIADAVQRGAAAVLADETPDVPAGVTALVGDATALTAGLAERFHGHPSRQLTLIGVTGTNGKTTTAWMVRHLLNATGRRCGLISTIEVDVGDAAEPQAAVLTTPGACELSRTLRAMIDGGCAACVMEVSSHALDQRRVDALSFDTAVFTNLSGDHLDYHGSMEAYAAAKARLFELLERGAAVVNADDPASTRMVADTGGRIIRYGFGGDAALGARFEAADAAGTRLTLRWGGEEAGVTLPLVGRHNVANLLAAVGATWDEAIGLPALARAAATMPAVPGRLERVTPADAPFAVLVDYAHTDDALRNVLVALRPLTPGDGKLRVMFGCGGDRDATKRPRMAKVACELADAVVVTSDNPRTEDPRRIIDQIMRGVPWADRSRVETIVDRAEAIGAIVEAARPGDVVLLAGKGHEDYQIIGTQRRPFDDRREARQRLASRFGTKEKARR